MFTDTAAGGTAVVLKHENLPAIPVCLRHWNGWRAAWPRIETALLDASAICVADSKWQRTPEVSDGSGEYAPKL